MPDVDALRNMVLEKAYGSRYSVHPHAIKMYCDLREVYYWDGLKRYIAEFVSKCQNCQQVKAEHLNRCSLIKEMGVPTWKCKEINMDFVVGFSHTRSKMTQFGLYWIDLQNPLTLFPLSLLIQRH